MLPDGFKHQGERIVRNEVYTLYKGAHVLANAMEFPIITLEDTLAFVCMGAATHGASPVWEGWVCTEMCLNIIYFSASFSFAWLGATSATSAFEPRKNKD